MIEIALLTAETILDESIFHDLFSINDDFKQTECYVKLTDQAKAVGVKKKFETLWKAYQKSHEKPEAKPTPSSQADGCMTEFDGKYPQMFCGGWICNGNGVSGFNALGMSISACYHPILPVQRLINLNTDKEKIKIAYKKGNRWKEITVEKEVIASSTRIVQLSGYGVSVTTENSKNLVRYLSDIENWNLDLIGVQKSTSKLGWIGDDFIPYSKEIQFDNETKFKDTVDSIGEVGSYDKWLKLVKEIRQTDRFEPKMAVVGSLASVLVEPLNALPFILNFWGDTGKGKTVTHMLATSCWANPDGFAYMADPKSTVTALELKLDMLNNLPMMLDDMSQVKEKYQGDFSALVYMLCSGKGKDRSNVSLGLNPTNSWKNIILTNYEHSLVTETMQGGAVNRIIDVECADGYLFENGNRVVEILKQNYGFAGRIFLDAVKQIGFDRVREWQKQAYDAIVERAKKLGVEKEEKQILPMSILLTADRIATEHIFEDGIYLDFNTCVDLLKNKGEVSENERAYDYIINEVGVNIVKFVPDKKADGSTEYRNEAWGIIEDGYVIINNNIFNRMCDKGNFSSKSFLSWADKRQLLKTDKDHKTKQKRLAGSPTRCIFLKMPSDMVDNDGFIKIPEDMQGELPFN